MKTLPPLVLLMCCLCHVFAAPHAPSMLLGKRCCPGYDRSIVPKQLIKHVGMTLNHCKPKSIIITTVKNKMFCVDPDWGWAKKQLEDFKNRTATFNPKCPKKL